ncbi:MAG: hypothetical protein U0136_01765 [Bdellovibrionota bacterium]
MGLGNLTLEDIKARMTDEQRRDMAEIVQAEVKRREGMKQQKSYGTRPATKSAVRSSGLGKGLNADGMGEVYNEIQDKIKNLRQQKLDEKLENVKGMVREVPRATPSRRVARPTINRNTILVAGILCLALAKILSSTGLLNTKRTADVVAEQQTEVGAQELSPAAPPMAAPSQKAAADAAPADAAPLQPLSGFDRSAGTYTPAEKQILTELDARRVELERRRQALDRREEDLKNQGQAIAERLAELKTLSTRMGQVRKERDNQYEARLEQLANVYGSMAPNEAAPLVSKLDEQTALALLKRMPGKRLGQILSLMEPGRAVELTTTLTDKTKLDELPVKENGK